MAARVPQAEPRSSTKGTRSSRTLKVEEFKWKINYRFLIGRAITLPRDVADSPPFKSFNTDEEESFPKKKPLLCSPATGHQLMQELWVSLQGWAS